MYAVSNYHKLYEKQWVLCWRIAENPPKLLLLLNPYFLPKNIYYGLNYTKLQVEYQTELSARSGFSKHWQRFLSGWRLFLSHNEHPDLREKIIQWPRPFLIHQGSKQKKNITYKDSCSKTYQLYQLTWQQRRERKLKQILTAVGNKKALTWSQCCLQFRIHMYF